MLKILYVPLNIAKFLLKHFEKFKNNQDYKYFLWGLLYAAAFIFSPVIFVCALFYMVIKTIANTVKLIFSHICDKFLNARLEKFEPCIVIDNEGKYRVVKKTADIILASDFLEIKVERLISESLEKLKENSKKAKSEIPMGTLCKFTTSNDGIDAAVCLGVFSVSSSGMFNSSKASALEMNVSLVLSSKQREKVYGINGNEQLLIGIKHDDEIKFFLIIDNNNPKINIRRDFNNYTITDGTAPLEQVYNVTPTSPQANIEVETLENERYLAASQ